MEHYILCVVDEVQWSITYCVWLMRYNGALDTVCG